MHLVRGGTALDGVRIVTTAVNVPGPVAAARLREMGAKVVKVEPLSGDPLEGMCPTWYQELARGQEILRLDLKGAEGRAELDRHLARSDVLLTSSRPAALERLGLGWSALRVRHPRLSHVAIVGYSGSAANVAGHDVTYQAAVGLLSPPSLSRTLTVDLATANSAVIAALRLLLVRERGGDPAREEVVMVEEAEWLAAPLRHGLTAPQGILGGAFASYAIYPAADGWVAVAALEPHFFERLESELGVSGLDRGRLEEAFRHRRAEEWEEWAKANDLPVAAVRGAGEEARVTGVQ